MLRAGAAALVFLFASSALAQTLRPPFRPLPAPTRITPQTQSYVYTARAGLAVRRAGVVNAAGIAWMCTGFSCNVTGRWPQPGVEACAALAHEIGPIVAYGRPGAALSVTQLAQCNTTPSASAPPPSPSSATHVVSNELSVVGGEVAAITATSRPITISAPELHVIGGAVGEISARSSVSISSPELSVIGR